MGALITPFFETEKGKLYKGDNLELMPLFDDNIFDLTLTDPPYGIGESFGKNKSRSKPFGKNKGVVVAAKDYGCKEWDESTPPRIAFDHMKRCSRNQIIFGGNYFIEHLESGPCWVIWDKKNGKSHFADCELAWTSFGTATRKIEYRWNGMLKEAPEKRYHPTQKPVGLFLQILQMYAEKDSTIFDPYAGSGTTALACERMGLRWVCIEQDAEYCDIIANRLKKETSQLKLF